MLIFIGITWQVLNLKVFPRQGRLAAFVNSLVGVSCSIPMEAPLCWLEPNVMAVLLVGKTHYRDAQVWKTPNYQKAIEDAGGLWVSTVAQEDKLALLLLG